MSLIDTRADQMFPIFDAVQMESAQRFASGPARSFVAGEDVFRIADEHSPAWLVLDGSIEVVRRDGLSHEAPIATYRRGQMTGEVAQLSGRPALAGGHAGPEGCRALPFDAAHLRALMIGSADIGEIVMRALILRRVGLIQEGAGTILIGLPDSADITRLQNFLTRSGHPNLVLDVRSDEEGRAFVERAGVLPQELPLVVCPNGAILKRPSETEMAACLGLTPELAPDAFYDVAIVGAGPSGLAAAVYAASEGLSVIVLDEHTMGGQAGASARIENYLGFPTGISGQALAGRAFNQALKFGAEMAIPLGVKQLECAEAHGAGSPLSLLLSDDQRIRARTVIVASGARYRRPDIAELPKFEGAGVSYWVSPIEAKLCAGEEVALVGGGNSAGQAIVFLAPKVKQLHLIVRRDLAATMSHYLIERIAALPNVTMHVGSEIVGLEGDATGALQAATFRHIADGTISHCALHHVFLFIGADPNAAWLEGCVETDDKGFIVTGRTGHPLETSLPGVFAIGDVRAGSTKRVASAVGEGAAVVAQIHATLAEHFPAA
ncbi:FAD-dependent oxidoreductase [Sphingomonas sp. GB1N7]|uniref:FAD-dependent oxidoreductase n=1 Tax=Parasphingomonas caseinilytica TaxID=3096158 RepID=UPI002FC710E6